MPTITIVDETTLGRQQSFQLDFLDETISLRELIRRRIFQEVTEYNARQGGEFHGLVQPTNAERTLNGSLLRQPRQIDWQAQYEQALTAFARRSYIVLVDNRQVSDLDTLVELRTGTDVTFLKLVPLVGGYQSSSGFNTRSDNDPLPLEQIPTLVFSEVMRDIDLFVGVASVGNDPTWQDGGPTGRYQDYWHNYSFGELSATARTRQQALNRLIPRLNIADRCSIEGRFLKVHGDLRTYRIHLGSGNILMEPNDQYLCIVRGREYNESASENLHLPFEGDTLLSIILSKAFLLARDSLITDPTITRQIGNISFNTP